MKTSKYILFALLQILSLQAVISQETINASKGCGFNNPVNKQTYTIFPASAGAYALVDRILSAMDLPQNFYLYSTNCDKVVACVADGKRYLLYNPKFLRQMDNVGNGAWAEIGIWLHQIGHHIVSHDFKIYSKKRVKMELESDRFIGLAMFYLGARYQKAALCEKYMIQHSYYPSPMERSKAIKQGLGYKMPKKPRHVTTIRSSALERKITAIKKVEHSIRGTSLDPSMLNFLNAKFPFPPPDCNTSHELKVEDFPNCKTLENVCDKITGAMSDKGYACRFMSVPNGVAIVTSMEQYEESGKIMTVEAGRWMDTPKSGSLSWWSADYLKSLVFPNKCLLRVFVFIITSQNFSTDITTVVSKAEAAKWYSNGVNRLPAEIASNPFNDQFGISFLVYEFEVPESNHQPKQKCPTKYQASEHLERSGLGSYLR